MISNTLRPVTQVAPVVVFGGVFRKILIDSCSASSASLSLKDGPLNPIKLFNYTSPNGQVRHFDDSPSISLVILNLLKTPLYGQHCLETDGDAHAALAAALQLKPASIDFTKKDAFCNSDQIPGTAPYPNPSRHGKGDKNSPDSWLSTAGVYQFYSNTIAHAEQDMCGGIAFSTTSDGSGALLGVVFKQNKDDEITFPFSVSADLGRYEGDTPEDRLRTLAQFNYAHAWNGKILIGAGWSSAPSNSKTLLVWVQDDPGIVGRPSNAVDDSAGLGVRGAVGDGSGAGDGDGDGESPGDVDTGGDIFG